MKKLCSTIIAVSPFAVMSQVHFSDGMKWYAEVCGTHTPNPAPVVQVETIEKTAVDGIFKVYRSQMNDLADPEFVTLIKVDGDKIFFNSDDSEYSEWYLLYDFGLLPGEGCYVYIPGINYGDRGKTYIKCIGISEPSNNKGWSTMQLEEYKDDGCMELYGSGIWIKNLCSERCLLWSNCFEAIGGSCKMQSVVLDDGNVIFQTSKPTFDQSSVKCIKANAPLPIETDFVKYLNLRK